MFEGKRVFVTGASRGIGKTIKQSYEKEGALVVSPFRTELDLADETSVNQYLADHSEDDFDVFVFNAGINPVNTIDELDLADVHRTFQVNLYSSVQIIRHYIDKIKKNGSAKVVFISSLYSTVTREGRFSYTASKHAITGVMKTLALELAPYGACVNCVAPGYVMTEMTKENLTEEEMSEISRMIPTGRFQLPEEIADAVLFLSGNQNKSITGQTLYVDGGFLCR